MLLEFCQGIESLPCCFPGVLLVRVVKLFVLGLVLGSFLYGKEVLHMGEGELRYALQAQHKLLKQLYAELDTEREASADAAKEAMSMIVRLQEEKASLKMEASHYKRMAEEKMLHAEEALEILEDLLYRMEMEIASLECESQAYQYKLLSLASSSEADSYDHLLPIRDLRLRKCASEGKRPINTLLDCHPIVEVPETPAPTKSGKPGDRSFNSYWTRMENLNERVKETFENSNRSSIVLDRYPIVESMENLEACGYQTNEQENNSTEGEYNVRTGDGKKPEVNNAGDFRKEYHHLIQRIERLEIMKNSANRKHPEGEEELNLLKEIKEQLKLVQLEMRSWKVKKTIDEVDISLDLLSQAIIYFWI